jgi:hypothetical protein
MGELEQLGDKIDICLNNAGIAGITLGVIIKEDLLQVRWEC